jgi:hypothetical protein
MIELFYTDITFKAMRSSGWSVDEARGTKFYSQHVCFDRHYKNILII